MTMSMFWLFFLLNWFYCNLSHNKLALSHITLLLPYTSDYISSPTRYRISSAGGASNGCVSWSIEPRKGIISIINPNSNLNNNCPPNTYREAIILAVSPPENGRVSATIIAIDETSHQSAECEVFIDKVNKLQVATSTRLIYLGKYESIEVNGFDNKGNKFSTLFGLPMIWKGIGKHLQIISFEEASLMLTDTISNNNKINNNNPLPVKGIATGQENIIVEINTNTNSPGHAHLGCNKATAALFVVMQLQLIPRIAYVSKCTKANFNLITTSHSELDLTNGKINETLNYNTQLYRHQLPLPNTQYEFKLINNKNKNKQLKMSIQQTGQLITSNIIENGKLLVEDKVTSHKSIENTADAQIYVVDSHTISAEIIKFKQYKTRPNIYIQRPEQMNWYLTFNEKYLIRLTLFDRSLNPICVRDLYSNEINMNNAKYLKNLKSFNEKYICSEIEWNINIINHKNNNKLLEKYEENEFAQINHKKDNDFTIIPNKLTEFTLKFSAKGTACKIPEILAHSMKKVIITSPVYFQNSSSIFCPSINNINGNIQSELLILIPYTGEHNIHKVPIFFKGGSGKYRLEINDTNIANMLNHNMNDGQNDKVAILNGNNIGKTYLFVIDYFNPDNFALINIEVKWIKIWKLSEDVTKEILINSFVEIPILIRDEYNRQFSALDGIKQVISASSRHNKVSLEFIALSVHEIIEQQMNGNGKDINDKNGIDITNDTHIIKNVLKSEILNNLHKGMGNDNNINNNFEINCNDMNGKILVGGINEGYDEFIINLNSEMYSKMFVSVYKPIKPLHNSVAIAININEPYTMKWSSGPLAWPIKEEIPVDNQFVHPLQVNIQCSDEKKYDKYFGFNYNGETLEFICYKSFHSTIELTVSNRLIENNLLYPVLSVAKIEIFCLPQFKFNSSVMEMGVGTRKNTNILYPSWINGLNSNINMSSEFYIEISQTHDDIISVKNNNNNNKQYVVAKRLGSSIIMGTLKHLTGRVYIHSIGFSDDLDIIVLFKGFTIEMSSYWIINGAEQIAHIEGLDGDHHILPFRHNFDNVFIEWISEDANIIELLSILPLPNPLYEQQQIDEGQERNNIGNGLSVKLKAHSVGLVNIKAIIKLRNPPKSIKKHTFELIQTITVIPQVIYPCNSIILSPNTSLLLSPIFNPDISIEGIGQIYNIRHEYSTINDRYVYVENKKLNVRNNAPIGENIIVTLILESPNKNRFDNNNNNIKQYPLTQAASLIVSIVQPTGLHLLGAEYIMDNIIYTKEINTFANGIQTNDKPFWSYASYSDTNKNKQINNYKNRYSKTENILCENQNITLKIAILDELARELNVIDQCKVVSNDTSIVLPKKDIKIITENIGGPMYAIVYLYALQPGYVTITFREKDPSTQSQPQPQFYNDNTNYYVYDDPKFLRTFLNIHVLSTNECQNQFDIMYQDPMKTILNDTTFTTTTTTTTTTTAGTANINKININNNMNRRRNRDWQSKILFQNKNSKVFVAIVCIIVFVLIIGCTWGNCINNNNNNSDKSTLMLGYNQNDTIPPAAFNPYASSNNSTNTSFQSQPFNNSNSFYM